MFEVVMATESLPRVCKKEEWANFTGTSADQQNFIGLLAHSFPVRLSKGSLLRGPSLSGLRGGIYGLND